MARHTRTGSGTVNFNKKSVSTTSKTAAGRITVGKKITISAPKVPKVRAKKY